MSNRPGLGRSGSSIMAASKTIILISGGNAGIGYEIVKSLVSLGPQTNLQILLGCRDTTKGETAVASMGAPPNVNPIQLDVTSDKSIELAHKTVEQLFGRLDVLINNAGTAGRDLRSGPSGEEVSSRDVYRHVYDVNVTGAALLTEAMAPLLEKSSDPKVVMVSSGLGSIQRVLDKDGPPIPVPWYSSSKAALNYLTVYYARKFPNWRVNAVCPGLRATGLNNAERTDETDPALGAVRVVELVRDGPGGVTGTYTHKDGEYPW